MQDQTQPCPDGGTGGVGMTLCPKEQIVLSDDVCSHCEYKRRPDDVSNLWCRYRIGKIQEQQEQQAQKAAEEIRNWQRRGVAAAETHYRRQLQALTEQIKALTARNNASA